VDKNRFLNKIYCKFSITSELLSPEEITRYLDVSPHRSFKKGDTYKSKHSGSLVTRPHNLWGILSKETISEEQEIASHISYLRILFENKIDLLKALKDSGRVEISLWLWFQTEDAGIGIDLLEPDLVFITKIINRLHVSVVTDSPV
jgi:hypothetical protein